MEHHVARRQFLKTIGVGLLTILSMDLLGPLSAQAQGASADPSTAKTARLWSSCCAYTYRGEFKLGLTLEQFIERAVEMHFDAVDMTVYYMKSTDPGYIENLRHLEYKNAAVFSGAACGVSMAVADSAKRADTLTQIKRWIDVADLLGAPHLRVLAGKLPQGSTLHEATTWVVETMKAASDYSGGKGIMLGAADHVGVSQSAEVCLEIMHRVNSPYAGINIDFSHFAPTLMQGSYAQIASCIPYATNTHIRNTFDDGSMIDMDRLRKIFANAGFKGFMSYEGAEMNTTETPAQITEIQRLFKKYSSV